MEKDRVSGHPSLYDNVRTIVLFREAAQALTENTNLMLAHNLDFVSILPTDYYLLSFDSHYKIHDQDAHGVGCDQFLTKYSHEVSGYIQLKGHNDTKFIGDHLDISNTQFDARELRLDHDKFYDFINRPVHFPGTQLKVYLHCCVNNYTVITALWWEYSFVFTIGFKAKK